MRVFFLIALLFLLAIVASACRGDDATPTPTRTLSPTQDSGGVTTGATVGANIVSFEHEDLTVAVGTTVVWTNKASSPHTASAKDGSWDSMSLAQGESFSIAFTTPGTIEYQCNFHPFDMQGTITVTQ